MSMQTRLNMDESGVVINEHWSTHSLHSGVFAGERFVGKYLMAWFHRYHLHEYHHLSI